MPCGRQWCVSFVYPGSFDPGLLVANRAAVQLLPEGQIDDLRRVYGLTDMCRRAWLISILPEWAWSSKDEHPSLTPLELVGLP